ncbi:MAG: branched-chain amino acid transaminase [Bdellovibrionales bacterium]|nr:branched-chain amino acid transaminase [Bdellovibrionales bacterium]
MARGTHVWKNGKILPLEQAMISPYTHGLHYGTGAFEGIRVYRQKAGGGAVFRLREHIVRLHDSLKIMGLACPYSVDQLIAASIETPIANGFEECYLRPMGFIADGPMGLNPGKEPPVDILVLAWEWGSYLGDEGIKNGIRCKTSSFIRPHVNSVFSKGKITGQYVTGVVAKREAILEGYDEALFVDPEGYMAEGSGENIFIVSGNVVKTTPLTSILSGITRRTVMEMLSRQGLAVQETRFTRDEMWCADEVFLCGTAAEITPMRECDRRTIGTGKPGPVTQRLQKEYAEVVRGAGPDYTRSWLTPLKKGVGAFSA